MIEGFVLILVCCLVGPALIIAYDEVRWLMYQRRRLRWILDNLEGEVSDVPGRGSRGL
jgi:hypothetical protein